MTFKTGADCKLYFNNGSWESPDWEEVVNAADVRIPDEYDEDDMTRRGSNGIEESIVTIRKVAVEGDLIYDPDDPIYALLFAAYQAKTPVEVAAMDGDITTSGSNGPHFVGQIFKFERPQELRKGLRIPFLIKPTPAANPFEWLDVA